MAENEVKMAVERNYFEKVHVDELEKIHVDELPSYNSNHL